MIASLKGIVELRNDPHIVLDVNGVGYKVLASRDVLAKAVVGQPLHVFIYTYVREDALDLYGFLEFSDLKLFELLLSVSGVGPKTAIGIFAIGSSSQISSAIITNDVAFFAAVPRLGKKNAQKIIIELKSKLGSVSDLDLSSDGASESSEVLAALQSFGFSNREAAEALRSIKQKDITTEEKIKLALKYLGK